MDFHQYLISDTVSVSSAVKAIDEGGKKVVFCLRENRLSGCFTDGDMRRYILRDGDMHKPVSQAMNPAPISFPLSREEDARKLIRDSGVVAVPIVDERGAVIKIFFRGDDTSIARRLPEPVPLVVMAGGRGTRLYPFTKILPKPLIPIGETPILDRIMDRFGQHGVRDVYLVLHHKRNMIRAYYNEACLPYDIHFVDEERPLGTGGGLSLLKGRINSTFFLSNCDCLLDTDYLCIYEYHKSHKNAITMVVAAKNMGLPYGVVDLDSQGNLRAIREKPEYSFLVNTGIYIMEPEVIGLIGENEQIDVPELAVRLMASGGRVGGYPITEKSWLDMGQFSEMKTMMKELEI
jgi:dTDP-glucose pyrophosphorylase|nr:sugar phosphate nucleotidyltransferase [uncultured Oscillibacter sp.]